MQILLAHCASEKLAKDWMSPIYAFFDPMPVIVEKGGCRAHEFKCCKVQCNRLVWCFLDTKDAGSTGKLYKHIRLCWGEEVLNAADTVKSAEEVQGKIIPTFLRDGSITTMFQLKAKGKVTYSHCPHTHSETK